MKITLEAKPYEILVEVPGYGIFKVHRLGAGTQADLADAAREVEGMNSQLRELYGECIDKEAALTKAKDETGLAELRATEDYKEAMALQKKITTALDRLNARIVRTELSLWNSDDTEALDRFMRELSLEQIRDLYRQAMEQADKDAK